MLEVYLLAGLHTDKCGIAENEKQIVQAKTNSNKLVSLLQDVGSLF